MKINHRGSLMTVGEEPEQCLGYLFDAKENGIYEPKIGRVAVTSEEAATHNRLLSEALIRGLDENCEVGMGGVFYKGRHEGRPAITTWTGDVVATDVWTVGGRLAFSRKGRNFLQVGKTQEDIINFRRVS